MKGKEGRGRKKSITREVKRPYSFNWPKHGREEGGQRAKIGRITPELKSIRKGKSKSAGINGKRISSVPVTLKRIRINRKEKGLEKSGGD